jgi:hypothetical protein
MDNEVLGQLPEHAAAFLVEMLNANCSLANAK